MALIQFKARCNGDNRREQGNQIVQELSFTTFAIDGKPLDPTKVSHGSITVGFLEPSGEILFGKNAIITIEEEVSPTVEDTQDPASPTAN